MKHSHKTYQEKLACMLNFGACWDNPQRTHISDKHGYSNKPNGTPANDKRF